MIRSALVALVLLAAVPAAAQTVYSKQDANLQGTGGVKLNAVACTAAAGSRWTGWIYVAIYRELALDVSFVDANASAADLGVRCETSASNATAADGGEELGVITATSATGVSTEVPDSRSWRRDTNGDGVLENPGTSQHAFIFKSLPAPWINCLFTCGAGGAAADTITATARAITP